MRNWNISPLYPASITPPSFQTTYEELKQEILLAVQNGCVVLPDYLWGIETKNGKSYINANWSASRLPMRNWNMLKRIPPINRETPLPDYLWGIETVVCAVGHVNTVEASRLPMRNWNSNPRPIQDCLLQGFQTTYEELKLISIDYG